MQEHSCTVRGNHYKLPAPFFVLATQNPIELEGTYPLPEAQLDRFLFNTVLDYLSAEDEVKVVDLTTTTRSRAGRAGHQRRGDSRLSAAGAHGADRGIGGALRGRAGARHAPQQRRRRRTSSRSTSTTAPACARRNSSCWRPRLARCRARRYHVAYEDVTALAIPVLRHRILLNFHAESDRIDSDEILRRLLEHDAAARRRDLSMRCSAFSIQRCSPAFRASTWSPRRSWTASSPACTARPISASARSSPNIAPTRRATICATWIGTSSRAPSAPT